MKSNRNKILQELKQNALTIPQLQNLVGPQNTNHCKWLTSYDDLKKFSSLEELMSLGAVVILLQIETKTNPQVGHFILLLDHDTHYEHFDSYGLTMDEELKITQEHHLTGIFGKSRKRIIDNTTRLQMMREDVNTCGRWVVARLLLRQLELDEFLGFMKYFHRPTDDLVAAMTLLLQYKK